MWTPLGARRRRRAQPGAGAGECPGRGQVGPAAGRERKVDSGAPGRAVLDPSCGQVAAQVGLREWRGSAASWLLSAFQRSRPRGPVIQGSPSGPCCAPRVYSHASIGKKAPIMLPYYPTYHSTFPWSSEIGWTETICEMLMSIKC